MKAALVLVAFIAFSEPAAARHCGHGKIYRVSMGVCVGEHSRLAREVRSEKPRQDLVYVDVLIPAEPEDPIPGVFPGKWFSGKK